MYMYVYMQMHGQYNVGKTAQLKLLLTLRSKLSSVAKRPGFARVLQRELGSIGTVVAFRTVDRRDHSSDVVELERVAVFSARTQIADGLVHVFLVVTTSANQWLSAASRTLEPARTDVVLRGVGALSLWAVETRSAEATLAHQTDSVAVEAWCARSAVCQLRVAF